MHANFLEKKDVKYRPRYLLHFSAVDYKYDVVDCQARFGNVRAQNLNKR